MPASFKHSLLGLGGLGIVLARTGCGGSADVTGASTTGLAFGQRSSGDAPATAPTPALTVRALRWPRQGHTLASTTPGASGSTAMQITTAARHIDPAGKADSPDREAAQPRQTAAAPSREPAFVAPVAAFAPVAEPASASVSATLYSVSTLASAPEPVPLPAFGPVPVSDPAPAPTPAADPTPVSNAARTMGPAPEATHVADFGSPSPTLQTRTDTYDGTAGAQVNTGNPNVVVDLSVLEDAGYGAAPVYAPAAPVYLPASPIGRRLLVPGPKNPVSHSPVPPVRGKKAKSSRKAKAPKKPPVTISAVSAPVANPAPAADDDAAAEADGSEQEEAPRARVPEEPATSAPSSVSVNFLLIGA